jgi:8-oxo-dGTP pyrophosphatase MutT (NUDIX family)
VTTRGAGIVLVARRTARMLFLLRRDGTWGIPGGHRDGKESLTDTALRELTEETGYDGAVEMPDNPRVVTIFATDRGFTDNYAALRAARFAYDVLYGEVYREFRPRLDHEHIGFVWSHSYEAPKPLHPGVRIALRYIHAEATP